MSTPNPFAGMPFGGAFPGADPDLAKASRQMYEQWEKTMGAWWDQVLESPDFLKTMGEQVGAGAQARGQYEAAVDAGLEKMHLPTRQDIIRLTRIATQLEEKLLQSEDRQLALADQVARMEATLSAAHEAVGRAERAALEARIAAAEARLELNERLAALEAKLKPPARTTRAKGT